MSGTPSRGGGGGRGGSYCGGGYRGGPQHHQQSDRPPPQLQKYKLRQGLPPRRQDGGGNVEAIGASMEQMTLVY